MCLSLEQTRQIFCDELKKNNEVRDKNLALKLAPIQDFIDGIEKFKWWGLGLVAFFISVIFSIGVWVGTIRQDVNHNTRAIASKADLLEQNAKINACMAQQNSYEADIRRINDKLDRLIENQVKK